MVMKVAFLTIILSIASSVMGQLRGAGMSPTPNPWGQSGITLEINKEQMSPSGQDVRHLTLDLATSKSDNVYKSFTKSLLPATGSGQKTRGRKRLGRNNKERLARLKKLKRRRRKQKWRKRQQRLRSSPVPTCQPIIAGNEPRSRLIPSTAPSVSPSTDPSGSHAPSCSVASSSVPSASPTHSASVAPSSAPSEASMSPDNVPSEERLATVLEGEWVAISGSFDGNKVTMVKCITLTLDSSDKGGPLALGFAGCNYYSGGFEAKAELADGSISFKPLSWTKIGCRDGSFEPEGIYRQCLQAATSYEIDDRSLKISGPNGCAWVFRLRNSDDVDCR